MWSYKRLEDGESWRGVIKGERSDWEPAWSKAMFCYLSIYETTWWQLGTLRCRAINWSAPRVSWIQLTHSKLNCRPNKPGIPKQVVRANCSGFMCERNLGRSGLDWLQGASGKASGKLLDNSRREIRAWFKVELERGTEAAQWGHCKVVEEAF